MIIEVMLPLFKHIYAPLPLIFQLQGSVGSGGRVDSSRAIAMHSLPSPRGVPSNVSVSIISRQLSFVSFRGAGGLRAIIMHSLPPSRGMPVLNVSVVSYRVDKFVELKGLRGPAKFEYACIQNLQSRLI